MLQVLMYMLQVLQELVITGAQDFKSVAPVITVPEEHLLHGHVVCNIMKVDTGNTIHM